MKVLVVDDDVELAGLVRLALQQEGHEVSLAYDGAQALTRFAAQPAELVVLDVNLPTLDGYAVLRELRRSSDVPVLMLTVRGHEDDEVRALDLGADDYLRKPFRPRALLARLRALLRRSGDAEPIAALELGPLSVDAQRGEGSIGGGAPFKLSALELRLLRLLAAQAPKPVGTERILAHVWVDREAVDREALKQLVHRLRAKLVRHGGQAGWIEYAATGGYAFRARAGPDAPD